MSFNNNWNEIDWVLLDMDGTILDKYFDDYFWEFLLPKEYASMHNISFEKAREILFSLYKKEEGTLNWTDLDFWSRVLGLDLFKLKKDIKNLIRVQPNAMDFLKFLRDKRKKVALVTNAHYKSLELKLRQTNLKNYFDYIVTAFDIGEPKERLTFWENLRKLLKFSPYRAMFIDDNEMVLETARQASIKYVIYKGKSSLSDSSRFSKKFPTIISFKELM